MLKSLAAVLVGIMLIFAVLPGYDSFADKPTDKGKANAKVSIPENAVQVAPGVYDLGQAVSQGKIVQGFMFIDYKKGFAHNPKAPPGHGGGGDDDTESTCFAYLKKDTKWKTVEPWVVNPANAGGVLSDNFVLTNLSDDIQKWEDAAGLTEGSAEDILGIGSITTDTLVADTSSPDGLNEVYFANIDSSGAIAVTIVWYTIGPPFARQLIEWDQVYDDVDFNWSDSGEAGKMDFENIAQHELGHSVGMGHPDNSCTEETMYYQAGFGETKKRDLNTGDIAGIDRLY